jgi:hypothetical protein
MGQRAKILTEILGFDGCKVKEAFFESAAGERVVPVGSLAMVRETRLVVVVERRWLSRCGQCAGHGLSWLTVRRAEERAIERWEATRPVVPLRLGGVDEKWLGRRHVLDHKFVTIVSNLETGEPVWIGKGRSEVAKTR